MNTLEQYSTFILNNYAAAPLTLVRGSGAKVWDDSGKEYLDFSTGIAVNALGHAHPRWVKAIADQAATLVHTSNLFRNPNQGLLAEKIVQKAGSGKVFFCNSGTEANEALLKLSRLYGKEKSGSEGSCYRVIVAGNAFHGRTFGGMSLTPQEKIQKGFRPLVEGVDVAVMNDLSSFEKLISPKTAAIMIEMIQGEGGLTVASNEFLHGLRALCDKHKILLMFDEIQTGIARTGTFFAFQAAGIKVDAFSMAKGLGAGFPIGSIWVDEKFSHLFTPGCHGSTFGGNPLATAAALAVMDIMDDEKILENVVSMSKFFRTELESVQRDFPNKIISVRGRGLLIGIEFHCETPAFIKALRENGLLTVSAGLNVIRLLPPLNVHIEDIKRCIAIIRDTVALF